MDPTANADGSQGTPGAPDAAGGAPQAPGWLAQLSDDLKGNEAFTGYQTISDLAKDHLSLKEKTTELEGKLGNTIPKLSENATDEEKAAFRQAMGVPETPDKYELARPDNIPVDEAMETWFRTEAHAAGMSQEQVKALYDSWNAKVAAARDAAKVSCVDKLREEWKGDYDANLEITKRAAKQFGGDEIMAFFEETGLGNDPRMFRAFLNIGKAMLEDSTFRKSDGGPPVGNPGEFSYPSMDKK